MFNITITALLTAAILGGATAPIETLGFYPKTTVVVELDGRTDTVTCVDFSGNEWSFVGVEDWCIGDYASFIICDNGTPEIYDDIICDMRYNGWVDGNFGYSFE